MNQSAHSFNLYVHFPFCRAKCAYCALHSRAGSTPANRKAYCLNIAKAISTMGTDPSFMGADPSLSTIYFGGGSPAICDLAPIFHSLKSLGSVPTSEGAVPMGGGGLSPEFTVELHPLDVTPEVMGMLKNGGVNRISLGVQSLDDDVLKAMGRLHTAADAEAAFHVIREAGFRNVGIDLIAGWPGVTAESWRTTLDRATALGLDHCSVYTLIREPKTRLDLAVRRGKVSLPSDDAALTQIDAAREALADAGLFRYEISNYSRPGYECRHNMSVWQGEDYIGLGEGAHGRCGLVRTESGVETRVTPEEDAVERAIFSLRTRKGLSLEHIAERWPILRTKIPVWREALEFYKRQGLVRDSYRLTSRGTEVCDSIIADLL